MNTLDAIQVNDPNNLDEVFTAMRDEMLSGQEYPLQPIMQPQSAPEATAEQQHNASNETPTEAICDDDTAAPQSSITPTDAHGFDFSKTDNPRPNPNVGLFTIKAANEWIDEASSRPMPCKLFGQLWFEHEICILFSGLTFEMPEGFFSFVSNRLR